MPRFLVGLTKTPLLLAALFLGFASLSATAEALDVRTALGERSIGDANAPVVINEFMSLGCGHCANFHRDTYPKIKAAYVDTGKVRFIMNDFPFGEIATDAHMLARCAPNNRYFGMVSAIFATQESWHHSDTPRQDLIKLAQLSGLSVDAAEACLDNSALRTGIEAAKAAAAQQYNIKGTPSFMIGATRIPGALPFEDFKDIIDKALAKAGVK